MSNHYDYDATKPRRWHKPKASDVPPEQLSLFESLQPAKVEAALTSEDLKIDPPAIEEHSLDLVAAPLYYVWKLEGDHLIKVSEGFVSWADAENERVRLLHGWGMTLTMKRAEQHQLNLTGTPLAVSEQSDDPQADAIEATPEELRDWLSEDH